MYSPGRPVPTRGALRGRHGRWERDAVDALATQDERSLKRTAKSCGSGAPKQALKVAKMLMRLAADGGNQAKVTGESTYKP